MSVSPAIRRALGGAFLAALGAALLAWVAPAPLLVTAAALVGGVLGWLLDRRLYGPLRRLHGRRRLGAHPVHQRVIGIAAPAPPRFRLVLPRVSQLQIRGAPIAFSGGILHDAIGQLVGDIIVRMAANAVTVENRLNVA